ncbi:MAG: hypothetical protein JWN66_2009 [Sphingomonas bacterium]|uniref:hypothetical protein n=1 Tax=Sphingomonas bacterium TaxID=1895847 RepID=UPI00262BF4A0|nr:hypothetical protein [Sphingomonas bacterium]MDB5704893.1 hypothetical protein [Sphingomonas bacterium]
MKLILLAALAATMPAMAQETPAPQAAPAAQPTDATAPDPVGGYQPAQPAMSGPATPGVKPTFVQAPPPDQAFPPPPPLAHYPICKRGQFDNCMQRGGK